MTSYDFIETTKPQVNEEISSSTASFRIGINVEFFSYFMRHSSAANNPIPFPFHAAIPRESSINKYKMGPLNCSFLGGQSGFVEWLDQTSIGFFCAFARDDQNVLFENRAGKEGKEEEAST